MIDLRRLTAFVLVFPEWYLSTEPEVTEIDVEAFSERFTWEQDGWNGLRDIAADPVETVQTEAGDCEDYALVIASALVAQGADTVGLAYCYRRDTQTGHVVAYDDTHVYSSGVIREESIEQYARDWNVSLERQILRESLSHE